MHTHLPQDPSQVKAVSMGRYLMECFQLWIEGRSTVAVPEEADVADLLRLAAGVCGHFIRHQVLPCHLASHVHPCDMYDCNTSVFVIRR